MKLLALLSCLHYNVKTQQRLSLLSSFLLLGIILSHLSGCGSTKAPHTSAIFDSNKKENIQIAVEYLKKANRTSTPESTLHLLSAADYYLKAEETNAAEQVLYKIKLPNVGTSHRAYYDILLAKIALLNKQPESALSHLQTIWTPKQLSLGLQKTFFETRAQAYLSQHHILNALLDQITLAELSSSDEKTLRHKNILHELNKLTPSTLRSLQEHTQSEPLKGWLAFSHATKQYDAQPEQLIRALKIWKQRYPLHPASELFPEFEGINHEVIMVQQPKKIALLLPLNKGPYEATAQMIRDGFVSALYSQRKNNGKDHTELLIFNTNDGPIKEIYQQAVNQRVDFIVGPLIKDELESLIKSTTISVPTLALNTLPTNAKITNLYQFGLPPEAEAKAIAKQAWLDGMRNALVLLPDSTWGHRMGESFVHYWTGSGGKLLDIAYYGTPDSINPTIKALLGITKSEERAKAIRDLGLKIHFTATRRQDPDFIFVASSPPLARQIKPLLNFYYASALPVYAPSGIYTGHPSPARDQDINGIKFCDMPWILDPTIRSKTLYQQIKNNWPKQFEHSPRVFALGVDAFKLTQQLHQMSLFSDFGLSGMTGLLSIDENHKIQRQPIWGVVKNGRPQLEHIIGDTAAS